MHLDYVDPDDADERTTELLEADADEYGQPSLFARALANDPALLAARQAYHDALTDGRGLDRRLAELVYLAVSVTNDCEYCVASHREALVEQVDVDEDTVDALARGDPSTLTETERAAVSLGQQVARDPADVTTEDVETLRDAGFDDGQISRLVAIASAAVAANTIADALDIAPTDRDGTIAE
jgi:uncharacterized peroxidase-related enzyme